MGEDGRRPELFAPRTVDVLPRHGRGMVRQRGQLVGELGWEQVTAGRQELAQLDKGDAALRPAPGAASGPGPVALRGRARRAGAGGRTAGRGAARWRGSPRTAGSGPAACGPPVSSSRPAARTRWGRPLRPRRGTPSPPAAPPRSALSPRRGCSRHATAATPASPRATEFPTPAAITARTTPTCRPSRRRGATTSTATNGTPVTRMRTAVRSRLMGRSTTCVKASARR